MVFFDTNIDATRGTALMTYLKNGFFLSDLTATVSLHMMAYNGKKQQYVLVQVDFEIDESGQIGVGWSVSAMKYSYYASTSDNGRFAAEIVVILLTMLTILGELGELFEKKLNCKLHRSLTLFAYLIAALYARPQRLSFLR